MPSERRLRRVRSGRSSKVTKTPGSPAGCRSARNWTANTVLPAPAVPATSVSRFSGSPPRVISSSPGIPDGTRVMPPSRAPAGSGVLSCRTDHATEHRGCRRSAPWRDTGTLARDADPRSRPRALRRAARGPGRRARRAACRRGARPPARLRRVPHRHVHRVGRRPVRLCAVRARARGRGRRRAGRRGRHVARPGRPRRHAVLAPVRRVRELPRRQDEHLRRDPRAAERRATCPTARRACSATARTCATSWAARRSPRRRS